MGCLTSLTYPFFFPSPSPSYNLTNIKGRTGGEMHTHRYTKDGEQRKLVFLFVPHQIDQTSISARVLMYFHGNAEDVGHNVDIFKEFQQKLEANIVALQYPGYGIRSTEPARPQRMKEDALELYWLLVNKLQFNPQNIIVFGRSLGSGPASYVASDPSVRNLVLMSPLSRTRDIILDSVCCLKQCCCGKCCYLVSGCFCFCFSNYFDNVRCLEDTQANFLIIHGAEDEVIPVTEGERLVDAYEIRGRKAHCKFPPMMTHNRFDLRQDIVGPVVDFANRYANVGQSSQVEMRKSEVMELLWNVE